MIISYLHDDVVEDK